MNPVAHILINYYILGWILPEVSFFQVALFSVILDIDHLPGLFYVLKNRQKSSMKQYTELFRSPLQEIIGVCVLSSACLMGYIITFQRSYLVASSCFLLHWVTDFFTVHTRPLAPFNNTIVAFFKSKRARLISEVLITLGAILLYRI